MSTKMVQRYYHANQAAMRVVAPTLDGEPAEPAVPKSKRKAPVVEIQTRAIAARSNRLCLPSSPGEEP
jgi:acyl-CoA hydrolase